MSPMRQLLAMRQLRGLCDSYESYPTVTKKKSSMSLLGHGKFSIKDFLSKCDQIRRKLLNGKLHFPCSAEFCDGRN